MTSRLRKVDRSILEQSSDQDSPAQLLDIDEQVELIHQLKNANDQTFTQFKSFLSIILAIELPIIILIELIHRHKDIHAVLILLSILLSVINLRYDPTKYDLKLLITSRHVASFGNFLIYKNNYINAVICIQLAYSFVSSGARPTNLYYLLPGINLISLYLFKSWFYETNKEVESLHNLKYKYKNV
ncbi:uncharacterized protein RJT20DRAFT_2263 [Scheffersomyces xylosifermentans]|uniref:uncharacterized protein n=1 Tax=Scheffersomyces xylosifermentans TaxID=1304137 RepID=UPI00315CDFA7